MRHWAPRLSSEESDRRALLAEPALFALMLLLLTARPALGGETHCPCLLTAKPTDMLAIAGANPFSGPGGWIPPGVKCSSKFASREPTQCDERNKIIGDRAIGGDWDEQTQEYTGASGDSAPPPESKPSCGLLNADANDVLALAKRQPFSQFMPSHTGCSSEDSIDYPNRCD